jgi:hypothetical protein
VLLAERGAQRAFDQIQPTSFGGDEDLVDPWVLERASLEWVGFCGGTRLSAIRYRSPVGLSWSMAWSSRRYPAVLRAGARERHRVPIAHLASPRRTRPALPLDCTPAVRFFRWPLGDQPGGGACKRGVTGPSSSVQIVVPFLGGSVESETTAVLLG